MILVNALGIFAAPFDDLIVDFREDESENDGAENVNNGVFVGENTASTSEADADDHEKFENNAGNTIFDVMGKNNGNYEEDGSDNHDVSGREARLTGTVRTSGDDDEFVEDKVDNHHQNHWQWHPADFTVDFFDVFACNPLVETEDGENCQS